MKNSGTGKRYDKGKLRYDLIHPESHRDMTRVLSEGAVKYPERNWENGMPWSKVIASLKRHLGEIEMSAATHPQFSKQGMPEMLDIDTMEITIWQDNEASQPQKVTMEAVVIKRVAFQNGKFEFHLSNVSSSLPYQVLIKDTDGWRCNWLVDNYRHEVAVSWTPLLSHALQVFGR